MINCYMIFGIIIFIIILFSLLKRKIIEEKYVFVWGILVFIILMASIFTGKVANIEQKIGKYYPQTLIILITIIFLISYIVYITILLIKQNKSIIKLEQEIVILKEKINKKNK